MGAPSIRARVADRLACFGSTIFTEMSRLAVEHDAVNLGQGFPDFDGPDFIKDAAIDAIRAGHGQYARSFGIPPLNEAIARRWERDTGRRADPHAAQEGGRRPPRTARPPTAGTPFLPPIPRSTLLIAGPRKTSKV